MRENRIIRGQIKNTVKQGVRYLWPVPRPSARPLALHPRPQLQSLLPLPPGGPVGPLMTSLVPQSALTPGGGGRKRAGQRSSTAHLIRAAHVTGPGSAAMTQTPPSGSELINADGDGGSAAEGRC